MTVATPWALVLAPVLVGLAVCGHRIREGRRNTVRKALGAGPAPGPAAVQRGALVLGTLALALAATGPVVGGGGAPSTPDDMTLVLAVDVSRSMTVRDVTPDRMTRARLAALRLASVPGLRVGLVAFAADASVLLAPTDDTGLVVLYLESLDPDVTSGEGSHLPGAIRKAALAAGGDTTRAGHVVLLTDGESFHDPEDLREAIEEAGALGVRVHALLVGTDAGGAVPRVPASHSGAEAEAVAAVAGATGGVVERDGGGMPRLLDALAVSRAEPDGGVEAAPLPARDLTPLLCLLALLSLLTEGAVDAARRRMAW